MKPPRFPFTTRRTMLIVAITAVLLAAGFWVMMKPVPRTLVYKSQATVPRPLKPLFQARTAELKQRSNRFLKIAEDHARSQERFMKYAEICKAAAKSRRDLAQAFGPKGLSLEPIRLGMRWPDDEYVFVPPRYR